LNEIIWSSKFDSLSSSSYNIDRISDSKKSSSDNPQKSKVKQWIIFFEPKISDNKVFKFETHISTQKHYSTYEDNQQCFKKMSIKQPNRMRYIIHRRYFYQWQDNQKENKSPKIKNKNFLVLSKSSKFLNKSWNFFSQMKFFLHLKKDKIKRYTIGLLMIYHYFSNTFHSNTIRDYMHHQL